MAARKPTRQRWSFETLESRDLLAANPLISEFLADNAGGLLDGDGNASDWIEIHNAGDEGINLSGWYLTDDETDLHKWPFPSVNLAAGQFLIVFASSQPTDNYVDPAGYLHSDFALGSGGEYLALVQGNTVRHEFAPAFPSQLEDISFGAAMEEVALVGPTTALEYLVPTNNILEPSWRMPEFSHASLVTGVATDASTVVITEAGSGATDFVELQNVSSAAVNTTGWSLVVNQGETAPVTDYAAIVAADPGIVSHWRLNENVAPQGTLTHGQAVIDRAGPDGHHGVAVYDTPLPNGGDGPTGRITSWRFFNSTPGTAGRQITPLLLEDVGADQYMVRGIGTTRAVTQAGLQTWDFAVAQGTDTFDWTTGRFHMGIRYGSPTVSNGGVVEFDGGANGWDFFGSATGAPPVVLNTQVTGAETYNNLGRDYSVQYTVVAAAGTGGTPVTADDAIGANDGQYTTSGVVGNQTGALVGNANKAVDFAGGEMTVPHQASLSFGGAAMTVEAWVQVDSIGTARWIVSKDTSDAATTPGLDYQLGIDATGRFTFRSQGAAQAVTSSTAVQPSSTAWHHVVGVQDPAAGNVRLYVDGKSVGTAPRVTTGVTSTAALKIADRTGAGGGQNFDGRIDEVAIYNRALPAADVSLHYRAGLAALAGGVDRANPITASLPTSLAANAIVKRTDNPSDDYFGSGIDWADNGPGWAMLLDQNQAIVDFVAWGYSQAQLDTLAVNVAGQSIAVADKWSGGGAAAGSGASSLQRVGDRDNNTATNFTRVSATPGAANAGLVTPFVAESLPFSGGVGYAREGGATTGETIGPPATDRGIVDTATGSIFLLDNHPFTRAGSVQQWSMFSTNTLRVTPLILRQSGGSYEIIGIGQPRNSTGGGLQNYAFELQSGTDVVQPGDYFGFKDGDNAINSTGVIEWDDGTGDTIRWFGGERAGSTVVGSSLGGGQTFARTYSLQASTISTIGGEVDVNVEAAMYNQRTSLYVRYPFTSEGPSSVDSLALRVKYDDAFIAYLNGTEVARRNLPATTTFASTALTNRDIAAAVEFEEINLTSFADLLVAGENVLAIHAFNDFAASNEFLIDARLAGSRQNMPSANGYFLTPTPGGPNGTSMGGYVGDTAFDHDRGFYTAPFNVAITTPQTPDATIYYTTDGSEPTPSNAAALVYASPVPIAGTTTLRAAGYKDGFISSNIDTHTYIFVADVIQQSSMAPVIRDHALWGPQLDDSLLEIPSVSVIVPGPAAVPLAETPISIEMIFPDGTPGFQANAGVERSGSTSLGYQKNSLRVSFKRQYGPAMLNYNPFGEGAAEEYDQLLLRSSHDSINYTHGNGTRGVYVRNRWINDAQREMGSPAPRSRPVHVYLNGQYWGLYDLMERPDGAFMASYFGGEADDYDALNSGAPSNGDLTAFNATMAATGNLATLQQYVDLESYADYMLTQFYGGNDWDWNHFQNWASARQREPGATWEWFHWDSDMVLRTSPTANVVSRGGPGNMWAGIAAHPEFRQILADRAQRLFFNEGVLTPSHVLASLNSLADEFDLPIVAESARWGSGGYTPDTWRQQFDQMVASWVGGRTATVIQQLRDAGLFPANNAPSYFVNGDPQHGGEVLSGDMLSMTAPGSITVTTTALVGDTSPASAFVPTSDLVGTNWRSHSFVQGALGESWQGGQNGVGYDRPPNVDYDPKIRIDVDAGMFGEGKNNSVYVRLPFSIADQATIDDFTSLTLRVLADDGYVAFLNGVEIASANAPGRGGFPGTLTWNSNSTTGVEVSLGSPAIVDVTNYLGQLHVGQNVLAIHGLNSSVNSSDALFWAELLASRTDTTPVPATIYYTTDGSDPRAGAVPGATATQYTSPVPLSANVNVKSRALLGGVWSALSEALFNVASPLRVVEVMYHAREAAGGETHPDRGDYEFLELQNASATTSLDLAGYGIDGAVTFEFPDMILAPGERVVVVSNAAAFAERYGAVAVAGEYSGNLSNGGETIVVLGPLGALVQSFTYDDTWHPSTDGEGHSLSIIDAHPPLATWDTAAAWRPSRAVDGSPGRPDLLLGDLNADDRVNLIDLAILQMHLGTPSGATWSDGDLTGDGAVTRADVARLARNFGRVYAPPPPAPAANALTLQAVRRPLQDRQSAVATRRPRANATPHAQETPADSTDGVLQFRSARRLP